MTVAELDHVFHIALTREWEAAKCVGEYRMSTLGKTQREFRSSPSRQPNPAAFNDLYQPEVPLAQEEPMLLGDSLHDRLLEPLRLPGPVLTYSLVRSADPHSEARSGILFGPPGTGKTSFVRKVAEYLGWPLVVLDPSLFADDGLPLIATVASRIFTKLLDLEDTVVFFDDINALRHTRTDLRAAIPHHQPVVQAPGAGGPGRMPVLRGHQPLRHHRPRRPAGAFPPVPVEAELSTTAPVVGWAGLGAQPDIERHLRDPGARTTTRLTGVARSPWRLCASGHKVRRRRCP